jgi:hypothetical protein
VTKWIAAAPACFLASALTAQDGPNARVFCDPDDPRNPCPGASCPCSEDVLAIRFERSGGPIIELDALEPGLRLSADVVLETRSMSIQGWVYGVRHEGRALTIESAGIEGTDAKSLFSNGFNATRFEDVFPAPAAGFISAVVLSLAENVVLPAGSNRLATATYRLGPAAAEAGEGGILLEITEPTFTDNGRPVRPRTLVDGRIVPRPFHRGDPDGDGRLSVADAIALLLFLFLAGPAPGCLDAGDADDDGRIDATDPVLILRWLFRGGSAPAPPGPPPAPCGPDPEGMGPGLGCDAYEACFP